MARQKLRNEEFPQRSHKEHRLDYKQITADNSMTIGISIRAFQIFNSGLYLYVFNGAIEDDAIRALVAVVFTFCAIMMVYSHKTIENTHSKCFKRVVFE